MLDETLVVWTTEFWPHPDSISAGDAKGREHHHWFTRRGSQAQV